MDNHLLWIRLQRLHKTQTKFKFIRLLPLGLLIIGLILFFVFQGYQYFTLKVLTQYYRLLVDIVAQEILLSVVVYTLIYAVGVAFSLPTSAILTITGGLLFGIGLAMVCVLVGATLGACIVFLAARTAFQEIFRRRAGTWITKLEQGFRKDAFSYILFLRLIPLFPFWLVNLVPAFLDVPLRIYALGTFLGIIPGVFVYASFGNGIGVLLKAGEVPTLSNILTLEILGPMVGLAILSLLPVLYKRFRRQ